MYVKTLAPDIGAILAYNKHLGELAEQEKDPEMRNAFKHSKIYSFDDVFIPYNRWLEMLNKGNVVSIPDDNADTLGIFITRCNH